jgi:dipeptidyl aminopeptidase/acylaminoacyl peptidase
MQLDDLSRYRSVADPRLHPDATRVAFSVSRLDLEDDRYERAIWLWDGLSPRRLTRGSGDSTPRWSPDGSRLAFLRKEPGEKASAQVAIMSVDGGEASTVTDLPLGVQTIEWSPDGNRLVAVAGVWTGEWADLDDEERARRPRRIDRVPFRFDNRGWVHDRRSHLYLIDPEGVDQPRPLTSGDFDEEWPHWRPDGKAIAFISARHERRGFEPGAEVLEVDVESGEIRPIVDRGQWSHVSYRPDGAVHVVGQPDPWAHPSIDSVWRLESNGSLTDLTGGLDRSTFPYSPAISPAGPQWIGESFLTCLEDSGRVRVVRVAPDGGVQPFLGGDRVISGVSTAPDGSTTAFVATTPIDPGELYLYSDGQERRVTGLNESFRAGVGLVAPEHFTVSSDDIDIDTWVYVPEGDGSVPALLNIHGGPATQYGFGFFDEFQMFAGAGYAVVACNPRGSSGRGVEFVRAVTGDGWGVVDSADVTAALEAALDRFDRLDGDRLGVMGGSYGGFLAAWLIAHDDRYRSAIVERALLSWVSFAGTSDIGPTFGRFYLNADPPGGSERLWEVSPLATADRITTPTLIIQSEQDHRCPIEQAEQFFTILLRQGVDTEFIRFPGEGHELSRSGKPRHRRERFECILEWHRRHLAARDVQD